MNLKAKQTVVTNPTATDALIREYEKAQNNAVLRRNDINRDSKQPETPYRVLHRLAAKPQHEGAPVSFDLYFVEMAERRCKACFYEDRNYAYGYGGFNESLAKTAIAELNKWLAKPEAEIVETIWRNVGPESGFATQQDAEDFIDTIVNPDKHITYYSATGERVEAPAK